MRILVVILIIFILLLGLSSAQGSSGPILRDLESGELYYPLNPPRDPEPELDPRFLHHLEEVQPPIDMPKRPPRADEGESVYEEAADPLYTTRDPSRQKKERAQPRLRTLPDGTFQRLNPETGEYESVGNPNAPSSGD